jgi:hypothetical protein
VSLVPSGCLWADGLVSSSRYVMIWDVRGRDTLLASCFPRWEAAGCFAESAGFAGRSKGAIRRATGSATAGGRGPTGERRVLLFPPPLGSAAASLNGLLG